MGENLNGCQPCCSVPSVVEIPGVAGQSGTAGTPGANGISAVTNTTQNFQVPNKGGTVTVDVVSTAGFVIGEPLTIGNDSDGNAGTFEVSSIPNNIQMVLLYLNYGSNASSGLFFTGGSLVAPSGFQPNANTNLPLTTFYGVGGSQNLTTSPAQILSSTITIPTTQTFILSATARFGYVGATYAGNQTLTVKIRRTNNSATDISNAVSVQVLAIVTTITYGLGQIAIPVVSYSGTTGDILQIFATVSATPSAGNVQAVECSLVAMPVS